MLVFNSLLLIMKSDVCEYFCVLAYQRPIFSFFLLLFFGLDLWTVVHTSFFHHRISSSTKAYNWLICNNNLHVSWWHFIYFIEDSRKIQTQLGFEMWMQTMKMNLKFCTKKKHGNWILSHEKEKRKHSKYFMVQCLIIRIAITAKQFRNWKVYKQTQHDYLTGENNN